MGTGVHAVMGTGGAPEGVLTAAALRCLKGEIEARLVIKDEKQAERLKSMGIHDLKRVYTTEDLASGKEIIFAATGVTDGSLLKGVRFFGDGIRTHSEGSKFIQKDHRGNTVFEISCGGDEKIVALKGGPLGTTIELVHVREGHGETN